MEISKTLVITVNFYTELDVCRQIKPYFNSNVIDFLVVDNGSDREDVLEDLSQIVNVKLYRPEVNLGYFNGAMHGYLNSDETSSYKWVIVSNPDILFGEQFFLKLQQCEVDDVSVIAPSIVSMRTNRDQNPLYVERPCIQKLKMLSRIFSNVVVANTYLILSFLSKYSSPLPEKIGGQRYIYAPHGSCMVFDADFFSGLGSGFYPSFLFCEELFVAEESIRLGKKVLYSPELMVSHFEHKTTKLLRNKLMVGYQKSSIDAFLNRCQF